MSDAPFLADTNPVQETPNGKSPSPSIGANSTLLSDTLIELAPDAIFIANLEGHFIEVNARACQLLGYSREELLNRTIADLIPPEDLPRLAALKEVQVQGNKDAGAWTLLHQDGTRIPVDSSAKILPDGRWVAFVRDLRDRFRLEADRQQSQADLQRSQARLKLALQATQSGMWDWDIRRDRAVITEEYCRLMGFDLSLQSVSYEQWLNQIHPDDRASASERVARAIGAREAYGEAYVDEYRILHPEGIRWISSRGRTYADGTGNPIGLIGHLQDITEQKQTEAALRQKVQEAEAAQQTLSALMEYVPEGITIADAPDVTIRQVSRYGQQLTGRPPEVIEGISAESHAQNWGMFYADGVTPAPNEALPLTRAVQQGEVVINEEWILRRPDGQQIVTLCNAGPIYDGDGEITGGVIVWRNINDRKQAELALQEKERQLQQLCDSMPQFVWICNASGELNYVNQQWIEYSGVTLEQSRNPQTIAETYHPDDVQGVSEQWTIALQSQQPFEIEARLRRAADGACRWFLIRAVPAFDDQGQLLRWYGTSTDIHDRKLSELNNQFLADLDLRLRQLSDAEAMARETVCRVGQYLNVDRCLWHTVDLQAGTTIVQQDWHSAGLASVKGEYRLSEYILPQLIDHYQSGQPLVIADVAAHDYTAPVANQFARHKVGAILSVPWIESGRWVAAFAVNSCTVRQWRSDEVTLLQEVVARLWSIIEQTRSAQALQQQQERYRMAVASAKLGTWDWDLTTNELKWDAACKAMFGLSPEAESNIDLFYVGLHPDDRDRVNEVVQAVLAPGGSDAYDIEYRTVGIEDGIERWVAAKGQAYFSPSGEAIRFIGTVLDITDAKRYEVERQRAATALRDRQERLEAALFAAGTGTFRWDLRTNALDWDDNLDRLFGLLPGETVRNLDAFVQRVHPDDRQGVIDRCRQCATEGADFDLDFRVLYPDGSIRWLSDKGKTFFDPEGNPAYMTGACVDITDRKQAEQEREQLLEREQAARQEAERVNRLKDDFFSALSHELRTPLNPILGWTKMLQGQRLTPDRIVHALDTIERNVRLQISLVDDLLDVARAIAGKLRLDSHPVDLVPTVAAAIETVQFAAQAKGITVHFVHPDAVYINGEGDRLQQVFWNLLSNAIKFTPAGGSVEVRLEQGSKGAGEQGSRGAGEQGRLTSREQGKNLPSPHPLIPPSPHAQITITDTGIGIAPDFLPHIFEYFRQAEGGSTRKYGGLGLGLAIVRHLVELHGGTITAESPGLGQGSTFSVKLPLANHPPANQRPGSEPVSFSLGETNGMRFSESPRSSFPGTSESPPPAVAAVSGRLVGVQMVLLDDEPDNLELLRYILNAEGAITRIFTSPSAALAAIAQSPPDLLVSDIGMPEFNGYEFIQQVRTLPSPTARQVPAIALTAFAQSGDQQRAIAAGYQAYLAKPIDPDQVVATVTDLLA